MLLGTLSRRLFLITPNHSIFKSKFSCGFLTYLNDLRYSNRQRFISNNNNMSTPSTPSSTNSTPPIEPFHIKLITDNDQENVLVFLRKFFFRDEPLNIAVKLLETEPTCKELEEYSIQSIKDGVSLMAVTDSGNILGVCLNGCVKKDEPIEDTEECLNPKFAKILSLLDHVEKEVDIFGKYPEANKIMIIKIISVDGNCRGKGIARILCDKTMDLAKEQGCSLIRVDCTSFISGKVLEKLGYESIYKLKYEDYKKNGVVVFKPDPPHTEVKVCVKRVA